MRRPPSRTASSTGNSPGRNPAGPEGAILGGAPQRDLASMERIGRLCGRAFQIRDDLAELLSTEQAAQKTFLADVKASKRTILLWYFLQKAPAAERRLCRDIFSRARKTRKELQMIRSLFMSRGVAADAEREIRRMIRNALRAAETLSVSPAAKAALNDIIRMIAPGGAAV